MPRGCVSIVVLAAVLIVALGADSSGGTLSRTAGPETVQVPAAHANAVLIFPFENASRSPTLDWLSEGLALLTIERLEADGLHPLSREERLNTLERMGLPASAPLSRASMFKVAEQADADEIVFGNYVSDGKTLTIAARVLRVSPPKLSAELVQSGPVDTLITWHAHLAWQLLQALGPQAPGAAASDSASSEGDFNAKLLPLDPQAFELYTRGLISSNDDERLRDLRDASKRAPDWDAPALALGEAYFARRDCESALPWLSRVLPARLAGVEAGFTAGVCHLLRNDSLRAEAAFAALVDAPRKLTSPSGSLPEAYNNLAIALARQGKATEAITALEHATAIDSEDPDYWFNLGLVQMQSKQPPAAVAALRKTLSLDPADAGAGELLAIALEEDGRPEEAASERASLGRASLRATLPKNPAATDFAKFDRIRMRFDPAWLRPGSSQPVGFASVSAAEAGVAPQLQLHLQRGSQFLAAGELDDAQRAFVEALLLAPLDPAAHGGLAEVYRRQGRPDDAVREFRAVLASRDDAATRVSLARVLLEDNRLAEARAELQEALKLDPNDAGAQRLLAQMQDRPGSREPR